METFCIYLLLFLILPTWLLAGTWDWYCHRATSIETTAGTPESILHALMLVEIGLPVLFALFLNINSAFFALALVILILHRVTANWDVHYAQSRRYISPTEQHIHSYLEIMPVSASLIMGLLYWPKLLALFGLGSEAAEFALKTKTAPLPFSYVVSIAIAIVALQIGPYVEELWRCSRHKRHAL